MVIGCAYAGFPVVGPVDQALSGLMLRASPLLAVFKRCKQLPQLWFMK